MTPDRIKPMPIRLKNMALSNGQWLSIFNYTVHDGTVVADTIYRDPATIEADFFHTKETNEMKAIRDAVDLTISILRAGIKLSFIDGEKSLQQVQLISPPLYDRIYGNKTIAE